MWFNVLCFETLFHLWTSMLYIKIIYFLNLTWQQNLVICHTWGTPLLPTWQSSKLWSRTKLPEPGAPVNTGKITVIQQDNTATPDPWISNEVGSKYSLIILFHNMRHFDKLYTFPSSWMFHMQYSRHMVFLVEEKYILIPYAVIKEQISLCFRTA